MPTLAWATDVHLDFVTPRELDALAAQLAAAGPDGVVLSGDQSTATALVGHLERLAERLARPIYFVLGNHDCYGGSIAEVRARARALTAASPWLRWLPACGPIDLGDGWALIGHDGWGDARAGDPDGSAVELNDWYQIRELTGLDRATRCAALRALGDEAAAHLARAAAAALARAAKLLVVTHVPPFADACWHDGRRSDDAWLPWFTCVAAGDALRAAMAAHPDARALVVCGHTHGGGQVDVAPNLRVLTGGADYGAPVAQAPLVLR
ncbi:MAG: metallophosphoesterase [Myxococcales bacterium]|nr:metallophosphoesterase [Myxococcales bacterium]